jgi:hypothetical protein
MGLTQRCPKYRPAYIDIGYATMYYSKGDRVAVFLGALEYRDALEAEHTQWPDAAWEDDITISPNTHMEGV